MFCRMQIQIQLTSSTLRRTQKIYKLCLADVDLGPTSIHSDWIESCKYMHKPNEIVWLWGGRGSWAKSDGSWIQSPILNQSVSFHAVCLEGWGCKQKPAWKVNRLAHAEWGILLLCLAGCIDYRMSEITLGPSRFRAEWGVAGVRPKHRDIISRISVVGCVCGGVEANQTISVGLCM